MLLKSQLPLAVRRNRLRSVFEKAVLGAAFFVRITEFQERTMADDDYVYDKETGEWIPQSEMSAKQAQANMVIVRDSVGNILQDGDQVTLIKDLDVKGAGQTLRRGTVIKSIRLTGDEQEVDCRYDGIKGLVLRAEFLKKR